MYSKLFGLQHIESVAGSDGWERPDLMRNALNYIFSSPKSFMFGGGTGLNFEIRVHNVYVQMWLEHGIVTLVPYLVILGMIIIKVFKSGFSKHNIFLITMLLVTVCISQWFGCLEEYSFTYYVAFLTVFAKLVDEKYREKLKSKENSKEQKITSENKITNTSK